MVRVLMKVALSALFLASLSVFAAPSDTSADDLRLYTLDCGRADFRDFAAASDTGEWEGRGVTLADPCFLIHHRKGWLLWDAGLPPQLDAATEATFREWGVRMTPGPSIQAQLALLGLRPADVNYLAFSHLHFDHVGNAALFSGATWILNRSELAWSNAVPAHVSVMPELFAGYKSAKTMMIDGDYDVFGDGSVRIFSAPGHTPGSSVLQIKLAKSGAILLSGDLYLTLEGRREQQVPTVNADRGATLASMRRFETIARNLHARVIVQHSMEDYLSLPKLPNYLD
jgi:N-acyl homoserine lactone hydrolase